MKPRSYPEYPHSAADVPDEEHFAALVSESYSGTDGRGNYESTPYLQYIALGNREQALGWVRKQDESARAFGGVKKYVIVKVAPVRIQRTVSITLDE